jgi:hypothetical protein
MDSENMKKRAFLILVIIIFITVNGIVATAEPLFDIIGSWKVENQFNDGTSSLMGEQDLSIFTGDDKTKQIKSFEFRNDGTASIRLIDGKVINAFYSQEEYSYNVQPQGGKDSTFSVEPIAGGFALATLRWRYPAGSYEILILILSKNR